MAQMEPVKADRLAASVDDTQTLRWMKINPKMMAITSPAQSVIINNMECLAAATLKNVEKVEILMKGVSRNHGTGDSRSNLSQVNFAVPKDPSDPAEEEPSKRHVGAPAPRIDVTQTRRWMSMDQEAATLTEMVQMNNLAYIMAGERKLGETLEKLMHTLLRPSSVLGKQ